MQNLQPICALIQEVGSAEAFPEQPPKSSEETVLDEPAAGEDSTLPLGQTCPSSSPADVPAGSQMFSFNQCSYCPSTTFTQQTVLAVLGDAASLLVR